MAPVPEPNNTQSVNPGDELVYQAGPQVIQVSSDSESDDEVDIHEGYVPLAQGPETAQEEESDSDSDVSDDQHPTADIPVMPVEKAEQIKAVMANIKLPNIPLWARQVPEEQWMTSLMNNIHKSRDEPTRETNSQQQSTDGNQLSKSSDSKSIENSEQPFNADFEAHFSAS